MKRVLVVTPRFPFPVIGGDKLRIYNIVKHLSRHYRFTLVSLYSTGEEEATGAEDGLFEKVYKVRQPRLVSNCNALRSLLGRRSLQNGYFYNRRLAGLVRSLAPAHDLVLSHLIRTSEYAFGLGEIPAVCEMTDAISMNYERVRRFGSMSLKKLIFGIEQKRCIESEGACLERMSASVVVSGYDKDYLAERFPKMREKIHVVPNGVAFDRIAYRRGKIEAGKIVFIGNMRTVQNSDAARHFAKEAFPAVRARLRNATFWIIGAEPGPEVRSLERIPGVVVTGRVDDIGRYAADAMASVCPIRTGAGVQNKVLESMAMGIPVVTTSMGLEGLTAVEGRDVLVADTPAAFAAQIKGLHDDPALAERISRSARRHIEDRYSWPAILEPYRDLIDGLLDGRPQRTAQARRAAV